MIVFRILRDQINVASAGWRGCGRGVQLGLEDELLQLLSGDVELLEDGFVIEEVHDLVVGDHHDAIVSTGC